jgi:hypothetical protein
MLQAEEVRERLFGGHFILKPEHLCQDRLGTNIGKALKTSGVCVCVCVCVCVFSQDAYNPLVLSKLLRLEWVFLHISGWCENGSNFEPLIYKTDRFTKIGSGQT